MIHDKAMNDKIESLQRAVTYGTFNEKKNVIADLDVLRCLFETCDLQRAALIPFAAAAGRPGRLVDSMTGDPISDEAILGLGVRVKDWKRAIELTSAE